MSVESKKCVLIIEDEAIFRMNYRTVLENEGYLVKEATTGVAGFQMVQQEKPDIILLDLILPESNGYETLVKIRELYQDLPIIVFSVLSSDNDTEKAMGLGANDFTVKGMEPPSAILNKISALL
jgi:CheY-like chemotaxis protein